jgi:TolA-binding protein
MAVWIDEQGQIVRPVEAAGASDGFRTMDRATFAMKPEVAETGKAIRASYVDALRDWVTNGAASRYVLSPDQLRAGIATPPTNETLANANFRLGQYLFAQGHKDDAQRYFEIARQLSPESWHFVRQALEMVAVGNASGPEFFAAVDSLGDRAYYTPPDLKRQRD